MTKLKTNLAYTLAASLVAAGAVYQQKEKTYPLIHAVPEWGRIQQGNLVIKNIARYSCLTGEERYVIDSICDAHNADIQKQVSAGMAADTVKVKK